jgi:SAM-dependent methyltransferase
MTDSQFATHGDLYAYSQAPYAEFYDLWVRHLFGDASQDDLIFQDYGQRALRRRAATQSDPVVIVDLATGTGRVVLGLLDAFSQAPVRITGVDHSRAMLDRAEVKVGDALSMVTASSDAGSAIQIEFVEASATTYADKLRECGIPSADLIFFSAGSIAHLTAEDEVPTFLRQTASFLRELSGVAIISVLDDFFVPRGARLPERDVSLDQGLHIPSIDAPGTTFKKESTAEVWDKAGEVKTERFAVSQVSDADGRVLWSRLLEWSLRALREEDWMEWLESSGLRVIDVVRLGFQRLYVLQREEL